MERRRREGTCSSHVQHLPGAGRAGGAELQSRAEHPATQSHHSQSKAGGLGCCSGPRRAPAAASLQGMLSRAGAAV